MKTCPVCGLFVADIDVTACNYADTPGGHADRHTLVIEAAERVLRR